MKTSEILKAAKERLAYGNEIYNDGKNRFICNAIQALENIEDQHKLSEAINAVHKRIDHCYTLEIWLYRKGYFKDFESKETKEHIQVYRHGLIDTLIAEYEAKGD